MSFSSEVKKELLTIKNIETHCINTELMALEFDKLNRTSGPPTIKKECCKRTFIRALFIRYGSITDPQKSYHLEFVLSNKILAEYLLQLISTYGITAKIIVRKNNYVLYVKECEQIVDLLNLMGAHLSLLEMENLRVTKDVRNNVNRKVNFEAANINKTVSAAVQQIEDIEFIKNTKGLSYLSEDLEELANTRLEFTDISMKDLGQRLSTPVGKSCVNHRLRRISKIAEELRG